MRSKITSVHIEGYRSIRDATIELKDLNVFIGANGSGKSNFISFFQMLEYYMHGEQGLDEYVGRNGGADALLYYGRNTTRTISAQLAIETEAGLNRYEVELGLATGDRLYLKDERIAYTPEGYEAERPLIPLGGGNKQSRLMQIGIDDSEYAGCYKTVDVIRGIMRQWRSFQFHNTNGDAHIRDESHPAGDNAYFRNDAGNLAAFLCKLSEQHPAIYRDIVGTVKQIAPYIEDIEVEKIYGETAAHLSWRETTSRDYRFSPRQMSDGTLRALALVTLLLQPTMPQMVCIDEPELGLHPEAICVLADLIKLASGRTQLFIATQSERLVDRFMPEDVIITNRSKEGTTFQRLDGERYKEWLDEYSISQLWETNLIGGRP